MFALGLEFSIRRLLRLGPRAAFITAVQVGLMLWPGYICGRALDGANSRAFLPAR